MKETVLKPGPKHCKTLWECKNSSTKVKELEVFD